MLTNQVLLILEQLLKIAQTGRNYNNTPYDRERYEFLIEKIQQLYGLLTRINSDALTFLGQETGYITPKVGVNALIRDQDGKILLEKRSDDHCWGLPGGWAEVGLTAEENIRKEVKEETGLEVRVRGILRCFSRTPDVDNLHTSYHLLFDCEITGGELTHSHESLQIAWKSIEEVDQWHKEHKGWLLSLPAFESKER